MADTVVVLRQGRVVAADTPSALTGRLPDRTVRARTSLEDAVLRSFAGVLSVDRSDALVRVATAQPELVLRQWLAADESLSDLRVEGASLEEALLALTGDVPVHDVAVSDVAAREGEVAA